MKLKRFLSLAVALCMVLALVPAMASAAVGDTLTINGIDYNIVGENLVANGTFETDAAGWKSWDGSALVDLSPADISVSSNQAHSGSQSLNIITSGGGSSKGSIVGQFPLDADVKAGDKYALSFWFYGGTGLTLTTGLGNTEGSTQVDIDCGGLGNSGSDPISCNISGLTANSWNKLTYILTAKEDSKFAEVYGRWCGNSYIDDVELYKVEQASAAKAAGDTIEIDGVVCEVVNGTNLITNGSFENADGNFDTTGWLSQSTNADIPNPQTAGDDHFAAGYTQGFYYMGGEYDLGKTYNRWNKDYTGPRIGNPTDGNWYLMSQWSDGFNGLCSVKRSFALESGKKYVFMYDIKSNAGNKDAANVYVGTSFAEGAGTAAGAITENWKTVSYFVEATDTVNTLWFNAYYLGNGICFDNFRLYEVEVKETAVDATVTFVTEGGETVKSVTEKLFPGESFTVPAKEVFNLGDSKFYQIPETVVTETTTVTVTPVANKYGVIEDALVSDNEIWGIKKVNDNSVFVAAGADVNRAPLADADGTPLRGSNDPSTLGKSRVGFVEFPVVDLAEGQKAVAHFSVRTWHDNGFSNGNNSLRVAAFVVNDSSWTALSDGGKYDSANAPILASYPNAIFSDVNYRTEDLTFDVTDAMKAAKAAGLEKFDLRLNSAWGAAYIAEREAAVEGGKYEGKAAYIAVEDANAFVVTTTGVALSKNGSNVGTSATVTADDTLKYCSDKDVYVENTAANTKEVKAGNAEVGATEAANLTTVALDSFGIDLVDGAQVRVGTAVLDDGKKIADQKDSGIRFIGTITSAEDSYYANADEFGIAVAPKGADFETKAVKIKATNLQDAATFTAAITNLKRENYNRVFVAKPYVVIGGNTYYDTMTTPTTTTVERSIYQVASGLLTADGALDDTASEYMVNVLNAYVNMTGARLTWNAESGIAAAEYANGAPVFFTVTATSEAVDGATKYTATLTANGKAKFFDYWNEFYRVNNSHAGFESAVKPETVMNPDGSVTLTFEIPTATLAE